MFLPTRAGVEQAAELRAASAAPRINTAFYHGGEPIRVIRPFLEGGEREAVLPRDDGGGAERAQRAGARHRRHRRHALHATIIERGQQRAHAACTSAPTRSCRWRGACTAASRAGACSSSATATSTSRRCEPTAPEFQLAGDSERVAITCADLGVRADELELPVPLDRIAYRARGRAARGARHHRERPALALRQAVEAMPVERAVGGAARERRRRAGAVPRGDERRRVAAPDDARGARPRRARSCRAATTSPRTTSTPRRIASAGYIGEVYGLPRHLFDEEEIDEWAERRGVLVKAIEDAALGDGERVPRRRAAAARDACRWRARARAAQFARPARARSCRSTS